MAPRTVPEQKKRTANVRSTKNCNALLPSVRKLASEQHKTNKPHVLIYTNKQLGSIIFNEENNLFERHCLTDNIIAPCHT